jgi:hypothetical protein
MAALALLAVGTQMTVILPVTGYAQRRRLDGSRGLAMAIRALQAGVAADQREVGFLRMVEAPLRPAIGRMAALALLA